MTTKNTRRDFTDEFKREAVSLLRGSGRPLTQVAAELGLQPSVLRRWRGPADEARSGATVNRPAAAVLVPLHSRFDCLGVSRIERGQVGVVHLDSDAPSRAGLA